MLQGAELDALLAQLEIAISAKDYAGLQSLMGPKFTLSHYRSGTTELAPAEATGRLRGDLMGPGTPRLDFSLMRGTAGLTRHLRPGDQPRGIQPRLGGQPG